MGIQESYVISLVMSGMQSPLVSGAHDLPERIIAILRHLRWRHAVPVSLLRLWAFLWFVINAVLSIYVTRKILEADGAARLPYAFEEFVVTQDYHWVRPVILAWLIFNTLDALLCVCLFCWWMRQELHAREEKTLKTWLTTFSLRWQFAIRAWEVCWLAAVWATLGILDGDIYLLWNLPLLITLARSPHFMVRIPAFFTPIAALRHSQLLRYALPVLVWMFLSATVFTVCYQDVPQLRNEFGDVLHSMKTAFSILTVDSIALLADKISDIPHCDSGDPGVLLNPDCLGLCFNDTNATVGPGGLYCSGYCDRSFGIAFLFFSAVVLGFGLYNLVLGVLVDAVRTLAESEEREEEASAAAVGAAASAKLHASAAPPSASVSLPAPPSPAAVGAVGAPSPAALTVPVPDASARDAPSRDAPAREWSRRPTDGDVESPVVAVGIAQARSHSAADVVRASQPSGKRAPESAEPLGAELEARLQSLERMVSTLVQEQRAVQAALRQLVGASDGRSTQLAAAAGGHEDQLQL